MATVYIMNRSGHDYTPAERFGTLAYLSEGMIGKFNTSTMFRALSRNLRNSKPDDYLLLTGQNIFSALACAMFAMLHKRLNLLLYCGTENRYVVRRIKFDDLPYGK